MKFPAKIMILMPSLASLVFFLPFLIGCDENWDESGVKLNNEMPLYALEYIDKHKILDPTEKLIAYYDVTTLNDSTEAAILTNERVIYHKSNRNQSIRYTLIEDVKHQTDWISSDILLIKSIGGELMKIEIAALNGGKIFKDILMDKVKN